VDPVSSLHAQVRVELLDLRGERRLRDMQALGSPAEVTFLGHHDEIPDVPQHHVRSSQISDVSVQL
jgi:hypothetical protein